MMMGFICFLGHGAPPVRYSAHPKFLEWQKDKGRKAPVPIQHLLCRNLISQGGCNLVKRTETGLKPFRRLHKHRCFDKYVLQLAKLFHLPSASLGLELLPYYSLSYWTRSWGRNRRAEAGGTLQSLMLNPPHVRAHKAREVCCLMLWVYVSAFGSGTKPWK